MMEPASTNLDVERMLISDLMLSKAAELSRQPEQVKCILQSKEQMLTVHRWAMCEAGDCNKKINKNTKLDMVSIVTAQERGNIWVKEKTL